MERPIPRDILFVFTQKNCKYSNELLYFIKDNIKMFSMYMDIIFINNEHPNFNTLREKFQEPSLPCLINQKTDKSFQVYDTSAKIEVSLILTFAGH